MGMERECYELSGIKPLGLAVPTIIINQHKHTDMNRLVPKALGCGPFIFCPVCPHGSDSSCWAGQKPLSCHGIGPGRGQPRPHLTARSLLLSCWEMKGCQTCIQPSREAWSRARAAHSEG